ncbi:MAG: HAMP domain-containing histidine kinase [Chloroflexi bacterium]|nr:HAMP domain-containing histidine kinase [Chloroflexota bacterium]
MPLLTVQQNFNQLLLYLVVMAVLTIAGAYALYRLRLVRWFHSLRWAMLLTMILTVALIFLNVWATAQLMFIEPYDLKITTALLIFAALNAIAFGFFVSSAITDSIHELARAAERVAQGDLETRLKVDGNDELAEFAQTFNWMAARLQEVDEQKRLLEQTRRDLIAWASHDLRTPLTAIRAMSEAMADGVVSDPQTTKRYMRNMQMEIEHLNNLIDNLFELAQLDAGHIQLDYELASLRDLISDTLGSMSAWAERKRIVLRSHVSDDIDPVYMASDKIQRVLSNLLDNALRYTPAGGRVTLRASVHGSNVIVSVNNYAPDMRLLDTTRVLSPFYRQEESRAQSIDGHRGAGLGLAITRGFVEAHGGMIWVDSDPKRGVTFSFKLPRQTSNIPQAV